MQFDSKVTQNSFHSSYSLLLLVLSVFPSFACPIMSKKHVSYFYDGVYAVCERVKQAEEVGGYYYGQGHPMKPHRIRMTHNLLLNYGVYQLMEIYVRRTLKVMVMTSVHSVRQNKTWNDSTGKSTSNS